MGVLAQAQPGGGYEAIHGLVGRTQQDLQKSASYMAQRHSEFRHYQNAQRSLSEFDRDLFRGRFNRGRLNSALGSLNEVLRRNTLLAADRDALTRDYYELRNVRGR